MATVPVMHVFATGEVVTAANLNNNTATALNFLLSGRPLASLQQATTGQSLSNGQVTAITWDTVAADRDGGFASGSPTRYTARTAGWYQCNVVLAFTSNANGKREAVLRINGVTGSVSSVAVQAPSGYCTVTLSRQFYLNVGDYVELSGYQSSGATVALATASGSDGGSWLDLRWESM